MGPLQDATTATPRKPQAHGSVTGTDARARTDAGSEVNVWVADPPFADHLRYFCHGHALGTYAQYGYTVYSGPDLQKALKDEWYLIGGIQNAKMGDIVVWHSVHKDRPVRVADHSAVIKTIGLEAGVQIDPHRTKLSSKNGVFVPAADVTLASLITQYGDTYATYRRK